MEDMNLHEESLIQIRKTSDKLRQVYLVDTDKQVSLGGGELKKIIVEVLDHESKS